MSSYWLGYGFVHHSYASGISNVEGRVCPFLYLVSHQSANKG